VCYDIVHAYTHNVLYRRRIPSSFAAVSCA
jgi:hypothetical protein